ncbi:MAG: peptide chain release factor N(5)-glutamine methyltransferase [Chloroflexi bacterium]|nr:peptide chain release factor N(5)-glutamine methyltransferase [Chloroflexota bacterium]
MKQNVSPKQDLKTTEFSSKTLLRQIQDQLSTSSESPYLDALVFLGHVTGKSKSDLLTHPSPKLTPEQQTKLSEGIQKLVSGTPLPYVLGIWEFFQLSFVISPEVLIPRPETEGLVELALDWFQDHPGKRKCLELGTGSGCIAVSLIKNLPDLDLIATDISKAALVVAQKNARKHQVEDQIEFILSNLLTGVESKIDLLVANLPYIPSNKLKSLPVYQTEPHLALDGGPDGLHYIKEVLAGAAQILNPGGGIFLELDEDCGAAALLIAGSYFPESGLTLSQDLSGQDRYLFIQT